MEKINTLESKLKKEQSQSIVRIIVASVVLAILVVLMITEGQNAQSRLSYSLILVCVFWLFSCAWAFYLRRAQHSSSTRCFIALAVDVGATTAAICFADDLSSLFYPVYLWIIIGHGIRFGVETLIGATIMGVLGFSIAIALTPYWQENWMNAFGLVAGLVVIPFYVLLLLKQLNAINAQLKKELDKTYYAASHDALTGLANRYKFYEKLDYDIKYNQRHGGVFAVMMIDLDGFKQINDTLGHQAGDKVLKEVATRLQSSGRNIDLSARLGGDEFAVIITRINQHEDVHIPAKRIIDAIEALISKQFNPCQLSASIGISLYPNDGLTADELTHHADMAMYEVKRHGKRDFLCYSDIKQVESKHELKSRVC